MALPEREGGLYTREYRNPRSACISFILIISYFSLCCDVLALCAEFAEGVEIGFSCNIVWLVDGCSAVVYHSIAADQLLRHQLGAL